MQTNMNHVHDPAKAKAYFEDKLAFTTGPVEFGKWIKMSEDNLVVVDVREAEDFRKGHNTDSRSRKNQPIGSRAVPNPSAVSAESLVRERRIGPQRVAPACLD
jgi:hypothetical protein